MNLKYRIKFHITNLDIQEIRDFKINLVNSNNILEFDSDNMPRLPVKSEKLKIAGRTFEIENSDIEYITEGEHVFNVFNFYLEDVEKKKSDETNKKTQTLFERYKSKPKNYWYSDYKSPDYDSDY